MGTQSFSIPARGRFVTTLSGPVRVQSSEGLAAIERSSAPGKLSINTGVPVADAQATLVFPHAVVGGGYSSTLTVVNVGSTVQGVSYSFGTSGAFVSLQPNTSTRISIGDTGTLTVGALTVSANSILGAPHIVAVLDIENETGLVTMGSRPAATEFTFPHVANGNGLFTGLAFATGDSGAQITVEVYQPSGGTPNSATITLGPNQQLSRLVSELIPSVGAQIGGYIRIRSDQPIWAWEIFGSGQVMASGPPL